MMAHIIELSGIGDELLVTANAMARHALALGTVKTHFSLFASMMHG
jgi:hypothetical protein